MSRVWVNRTLQWLHPKDDERNLISATFHMITITLIAMSMVDLPWFNIASDINLPSLSLGQFFWFGYTNQIDYTEYEYINGTIVNTMRSTILLCFMGIIFSLAGFLLDIIGPKTIIYRMVRKYAVTGTFAVLWISAVISVSFYAILLIEESLEKVYPKVNTAVTFGSGFYLIAASGSVGLIGIFYNLILAHHSPAYRDDDHCLIDGFDDGLDTFNSPTPPPPYNVPPPPYTP